MIETFRQAISVYLLGKWRHFVSLFSFRYSFICQGTSTRRQWKNLCGLRVKMPPVNTSL